MISRLPSRPDRHRQTDRSETQQTAPKDRRVIAIGAVDAVSQGVSSTRADAPGKEERTRPKPSLSARL